MHKEIRPIERREIITYYSIPATQKIKVINKGVAGGKHTTAFLSIHILRGQITFYKTAAELMNVKAGDLMSFLFLDDSLYIFKSIDGNSVCRLADGGFRLVSRLVCKELNKQFGTTKTVRYEIKKMKSEFGGNPLFELTIPRHMLKNFQNKKNKQQL